jgi:hypothetical protein
MRLTASAASNPDGTGISSRSGRQTNSAYAPLIGIAATSSPGSIPETPVPEPIHNANQIPTRREGHQRRLGMNALARHYVGQRDTCGQYSHPNFTILWLGALFFNHPKWIGPAVVSDDDARVSHDLFVPSMLGASVEQNSLLDRDRTGLVA